MIELLMSHESIAIWPQIAMVIFFTIMVGMCFWVFRPHSAEIYKEISQLPFDKAKKGVQS